MGSKPCRDLAGRLRRLANAGWGYGAMALRFERDAETVRSWARGFSPKGSAEHERVYAVLQVLEAATPESDGIVQRKPRGREPGARQLAAALLYQAIVERWIPDQRLQAHARVFLQTPASVEFWAHMAGVPVESVVALCETMTEQIAIEVIKWLRSRYHRCNQEQRNELFQTPEIQIAAGKLGIRRALYSEVRAGKLLERVSRVLGHGEEDE